ncbi:hypothetical protein H0H87_011103 [Tephrocybe sp. NHM501043]|nr:hypothetical protein H0H87_011103 [Tephrocybe sp. NHM501043]
MRGNKTTETSRLQSAVWWTPVNSSLPADAETRTLEGEIHLSRNLQSTSASPFFSVKYTIQFSALNSDAIHPESGIIKTPLTHTITIGTFAARGPRTREYSARS